MTESELNEIENRLNSATKGNWIPMIEGITHESGSDFIMTNVNNSDDYKNIERGQDIELNGGTKDDITVWINLGVCQKLMNKEKQINSILALECNCASVDRIGEIRKELLAILPGTQIIEHDSKALARAEARTKTKKTAEQEIVAIKQSQHELRAKRENMVAIMIPFIAILCMATIALLTFLNVRERIYELGLLLSLGVKTSKILMAFLLKACFSAVLGALIGIGLFYLCLNSGRESFFNGYEAELLMQNSKLILVLLLMPLLTVLATWLPALWAAQTDPAEVLRHD